jgi:hypothetical protein
MGGILYLICRTFYCLEAVGARFKIDRNRFDDFFRTCLRRTLAQLLCDVRREQKQGKHGGGHPNSSRPGSPVLSAGNIPSAGAGELTSHAVNSRDLFADDRSAD